MYDPTNTGHHDLRGPWYQGPNKVTERDEDHASIGVVAEVDDRDASDLSQFLPGDVRPHDLIQ